MQNKCALPWFENTSCHSKGLEKNRGIEKNCENEKFLPDKWTRHDGTKHICGPFWDLPRSFWKP
jgi:hypothetical protein